MIDRINELEPNKYVVYEGIVKTIEEAKADQLLSSIWDGIMSGKIELRAVSNFSMDGEACVKAHIQEETDDYFDFNNTAPYGIRFCFDSENLPFRLEERWYNGFRYWTPEGKRSFKGTKFRIVNNKLVLS